MGRQADRKTEVTEGIPANERERGRERERKYYLKGSFQNRLNTANRSKKTNTALNLCWWAFVRHCLGRHAADAEEPGYRARSGR